MFIFTLYSYRWADFILVGTAVVAPVPVSALVLPYTQEAASHRGSPTPDYFCNRYETTTLFLISFSLFLVNHNFAKIRLFII